MKNNNWKYWVVILLMFAGCDIMAKSMSDDTERVTIVVVGGNQEIGQNREDNVPYEVYLNRTTNTLEVISYDTKPAILYLCDAAGNIVDVLYISGEGLYCMQVPSGYPRLYMMLMSSDIFYAEINL